MARRRGRPPTTRYHTALMLVSAVWVAKALVPTQRRGLTMVHWFCISNTKHHRKWVAILPCIIRSFRVRVVRAHLPLRSGRHSAFVIQSIDDGCHIHSAAPNIDFSDV